MEAQGLTEKILDYIQSRANDKLEKLEKDISKLQGSDNADQSKLEALEDKLRDEKEKFKPVNWLTDAANRAGQIQFVTHAIKFLHSDAKGSNVYLAEDYRHTREGYVSTASIKTPALDIVGNAAALDVGKLLMLECEGKKLVDCVLADDVTPFLSIAVDQTQAESWLAGFKNAVASKELSSHKLAKQVYWPINTGESDSDHSHQYHLLSPLFASAFAQKVYDVRRELREVQFSKDEELKAKGHSRFPHLAVQTYGGTKPQNISQLNSQRYGKNYLLDNRPPVWTEIEKLPYNTESVFKSAFPRRAYKKAKAAHRLKAYLEKVFNDPSTFDIRQARKAGVEEIVDILLLFAAHLHTQPAGWTEHPECKLSLDEQLWLDPGRAKYDEKFRQDMEAKKWHDQVAHKFATWLNNALRSSTLNPGDVEHAQWKVYVAQELRLTERARKEYF
ncbi:type I-F CRISPR-associated protein Csy1 [Litoribrevibacter albus]|uniref:Type I-F CRISPR-associated protein Csy1 n=1 Tax=Litoribrevibacter albus TaxID=1473156 RepID=A0AA37SBU5_9GAMM|nr:type I-F CRISPR-associated protein Csy1 [Litoribrevibacter albus]GLQ32439.1 type I-F CRISPR-associated protein Csy1 [Litoribrevibacter albus]